MRTRLATAATVGLIAGLALVGCSSSDDSGASPSASASPSTSQTAISIGAQWELELTASSLPLATWPSDIGAPDNAEVVATGFASQLGANQPVQFQAMQYQVKGNVDQVLASQKQLLGTMGWQYQGTVDNAELFTRPEGSLRIAVTPSAAAGQVYLYQWTDLQAPSPAVP